MKNDFYIFVPSYLDLDLKFIFLVTRVLGHIFFIFEVCTALGFRVNRWRETEGRTDGQTAGRHATHNAASLAPRKGRKAKNA